MALANDLVQQVSQLTADLIARGLSSDQNFPASYTEGSTTRVTFSGEDDLSITLKNVAYDELYNELKAKRQFNFQLIDGALVQIQYLIKGQAILKHRLAFFPAPDLSEYQNNSEIYDEDEIYADILAKNIVTTPIRFDFDRDNFEDDTHPMSHLTVGQYKNCRIAVGGPLSPYLFVHFLLKSFYNTAFQVHSDGITAHPYRFEPTISAKEKSKLHIMTPTLAGV